MGMPHVRSLMRGIGCLDKAGPGGRVLTCGELGMRARWCWSWAQGSGAVRCILRT